MIDNKEQLPHIDNPPLDLLNTNPKDNSSETSYSKIYSLFSSLDSPLNEILPLLTSLNKTASEEPELFSIIFPTNNPNYFFELLIRIYLNNLFQNTNESSLAKNTILELLSKLCKFYNCKWETFEIVYEFLSKYFRKENKTPDLTKNTFEQILQLIEILYGVIENDIGNNNVNKEVNYLPNAFFYIMEMGL